MLGILLTVDGWMSLLTLIVMEIILGIDNIIFISIIADRLQPEKQQRARITGLSLALLVRIGLLFSISFLVHLTNPLVTFSSYNFSIRDLILIAGGLFLLYKTIIEIHHKIMGSEEVSLKKATSFSTVIVQIIIIDVVFSVDSILTAIGLVENVLIMIIAVIVAMFFMILFARSVSGFINRNPRIKMLALAFLLMIAFILIADGFHFQIDKKYLYIAIAFSFLVEFLNMRERANKKKKLVTE